uniref:Uncharacterized protein n=1 Tax=viral metagenome TaxID=1070528 RepID=A0A6C0EY52_9ZZZZ
MSNAVKLQTVGEATSSVKGVFESTFSSLAKSLSLPQLKDSFLQNIIYILMVIVILIGILVYIQMVGINSVNPLDLPPTKEVKKIEIQKIVEGFDTEQTGGLEESAHDINNANDMGNEDGNLYNGVFNNIYNSPYNNISGGDDHLWDEMTTDIHHDDSMQHNKKKK